MCTLIVIHRLVPGAPLVVAANRDEFYDRPAVIPTLLSVPELEGRAGFSVLAPRDCRAGGTWLGINRHEVFAAVTNRPGQPVDPSRRSRGKLVLDALEFSSARDAARELAKIPNDQYNGFNLLVADRRDVFTLTPGPPDGNGRISLTKLDPGSHVIGNAETDDTSHPKTRWTLDAVKAVEHLPADELMDALAEICRDHSSAGENGGSAVLDGPIASVCVHRGEFGTRSSVLLQLGDGGGSGASGQSFMRYADSAPCDHPYLDFTPLLKELSRTASYTREEPMARNAS